MSFASPVRLFLPLATDAHVPYDPSIQHPSPSCGHISIGVFIHSQMNIFLSCRSSGTKHHISNNCSKARVLFRNHRSHRARRERRICCVAPSSIMAGAGAGGSSRLLRATTKALKTDNNQKSSSTTSGKSSPYGIPSLKFPFPWEPNKTQRISHRAAEQRAALIALGAASITPEKKMGVFLSEEAKSVDLLLPLAYEITRRLILRQFGATWLAMNKTCWSKIAEAMIHRVIISEKDMILQSLQSIYTSRSQVFMFTNRDHFDDKFRPSSVASHSR